MRTGGTRKKPIELTIKPWVIYLWRNGDKMEGASPIVTKDGLKGIYCYGWEIEKVPNVKRNEDKHQAWRAKVQVKNMLNNTLNIINWYGRRILDSNGNIDNEKVLYAETQTAMQASKNNVDMNDLYPIKRFPTKTITPQKAREYKFI